MMERDFPTYKQYRIWLNAQRNDARRQAEAANELYTLTVFSFNEWRARHKINEMQANRILLNFERTTGTQTLWRRDGYVELKRGNT